MGGKSREIGRVADAFHLMDRRRIGRDLDDILFCAKPAHDLLRQRIPRRAKGGAQALIANDITDKLGSIWTGLAKQNGVVIAIHMAGQIDQGLRILDDIDFSGPDLAVDEIPQPKPVEIELCRPGDGIIHDYLSGISCGMETIARTARQNNCRHRCQVVLGPTVG